MQSKSKSSNEPEPDPWWRGSGFNGIPPPAAAGGKVSSVSSPEYESDTETNNDESLSNSRNSEEGDDVSKEAQGTASSRSVGNSRQEDQNLQHATTVGSMHNELLTQAPQFELVSHSIACASNPYQEQYIGGLLSAYGNQPLGYPQFIGMPHARMLLPLEMAQEPVYVNAKQYQGILRRRQARAKAEVERKLIKNRKPYLHESRHQHAMRRARGTGGRFAKKTEGGSTQLTAEGVTNRSGPVGSSHSSSSSGSEPLPSDSVGTWNSSNSQNGSSTQGRESLGAHNYINGGSHYHNHGGLQTSAYGSYSGGTVEDGDCSGQQRGGLSNQGSQRPVVIQ